MKKAFSWEYYFTGGMVDTISSVFVLAIIIWVIGAVITYVYIRMLDGKPDHYLETAINVFLSIMWMMLVLFFIYVWIRERKLPRW